MEKAIELIFNQPGVLCVVLYGLQSGVVSVLSRRSTRYEVRFESLDNESIQRLILEIHNCNIAQ